MASMKALFLILAFVFISCAMIIPLKPRENHKQCVKQKCPEQQAACMKDPKCIPTLEECEKKCKASASCWLQCLTTNGNKAAMNSATCGQTNGCNKILQMALAAANQKQPVAEADPRKCIRQKCPTQAAACTADAKCFPSFDQCRAKCGADTQCWKTCLRAIGNQPAIESARCGQINGCDKVLQMDVKANAEALLLLAYQKCTAQKCPSQWAACKNDSSCLPALNECEKKCLNNTTCWIQCLKNKKNKAANEALLCSNVNGCYQVQEAKTVAEADPRKCIRQKCPTQAAACTADAKCFPSFDQCRAKCGADTQCWKTCLRAIGNQPAIESARCGQINGCDKVLANSVKADAEALVIQAFQKCIEQKCSDQSDACTKDPSCQPTIEKCFPKCQANDTCLVQCLKNEQQTKTALKVFQCAQSSKCYQLFPDQNDPLICVAQKCPKQQMACKADDKCAPAFEECTKKCGAQVSCWVQCLLKNGNQKAVDLTLCAHANKCDQSLKKKN